MTDAASRGWGTATAAGFREQHIVTCTAGGIHVPVHEDVLQVFRYLFTEMAKHYKLAGYADDWGYCLRCIRGTGPGLHDPSCVLSNHSWGLAVDLDASVNPMTRDLQASHEFVRAVVDPILAPFHGRLVWGGEYTGTRKDYMHFEYVGPRSAAAGDSATAQRLLARTLPSPAPRPVPVAPVEARMIVRFSSKPDIWEVVGSHLEHVTAAAFHARGLTATDVKIKPDSDALNTLPKTDGAA